MNNQDCLNQKFALLSEMPDTALKRPRVPLERFHQESEYLLKWCLSDRRDLVAAGFNWRIVEDLPVRIGASRQARTDWLEARFLSRSAATQWEEIARVASDFRERLLLAFLYAYRQCPVFLGQLKEIAAADEDVTMADDFEYLITMARERPEPLSTVNFNFALVHDAEFLMMRISEIRAEKVQETAPIVAARARLRAAAYTHLKESVDAIRACGQYVFSRNAKRLRGYLQDSFTELYDRLEDKTARYGLDLSPGGYASSAWSSARRVRAAS